jgi:uncharacterized membrane protein YecN with MAPEG domain
MHTGLIPISTLFIGLNGILAFALSYIAATERTRARVWHGESKEDVTTQPDPLANPSAWVATIERLSQKLSLGKVQDDGILQRKVRAHGNFAEYVPHGLLFVVALELMKAHVWLVWLLGGTLTVARIAHAYGLIRKYGPFYRASNGIFPNLVCLHRRQHSLSLLQR